MDEKWLLKRIQMAAEQDDCHCVRLHEMFSAGHPDLYIKHPKFGQGIWVELKWAHLYRRPKDGHQLSPLGLTPLQRHFLEREQEVGGLAMWVAGIAQENTLQIFAGRQARQEWISVNDICQTIQVRPKIEPINLFKILEMAI